MNSPGTPRPEVLALIPARGGSKGIPRKNILPILGKPLIAYSILQARQSKWITRTIVSTDDPEIAQVAREFEAETPFLRPTEFAQDLSLDLEVFKHALEWLRDHEGYICDLVVHLRPTGPVRRVELIDEAVRLMLEHPEADALRSVSIPDQTPYKMWRIEGEYLKPLLSLPGVEEPYCMPRQTLPEVYWQNGYVDIIPPSTTWMAGDDPGAGTDVRGGHPTLRRT
ncbi:MAG: acylneuraminate cytidylyltransferase family protein [Chloroflexi bacterium]|nr:acylneuraminate cytidylyltransferase family protein [Chloroflexota bacterium]